MDRWDPEFLSLSQVFAPFAGVAAAFAGALDWPPVAAYDALAQRLELATERGLPLRFVPATPKPRRRRARAVAGEIGYETRIDATGEVSTRERSWHDFFNLLAWATYPRTKAALNRRQVEATIGPGRTREQDRLAMLDEGGIIVAGADRLVLGHALCESIMIGRLDIHGLACDVGRQAGRDLAQRIAGADAALAGLVARAHFASAERLPVISLRELL